MTSEERRIYDWLKRKHQEAIDKTDKAGSYLMQGFHQGRTNLAYELMRRLERGD